MRRLITLTVVATAFTVALASMTIDRASAKTRQIGSYSTNALRSACSKAGGTFGTGQRGEHTCSKGGNLIDCNGRNQCEVTTPRSGGNRVTGGPITTGKATTYLGATTRSFGQGAPADLKPGIGRYHR